MKVYRLEYNIDGYTTKNEPPKFFYRFEDAKKALEKVSGVYIYDGKWNIEGCKRTEVYEADEELSLLAIIYTGEERDAWSINWGRVRIEPVEIPASELSNDRIYELYKRKGYYSWLYAGIDGVTNSNMYSERGLLEVSGSKNHIRRLARIRYKKLARVWNNKEYEENCNPLCGGGGDYLSIGEYKVS